MTSSMPAGCCCSRKDCTTVVLLSLAIGIGATTALFTAVNGLLLQTIPVPNPGELVVLKWSGKNNMVRSSSDYGFSRPHKGENVRSTFSNHVYQQLKSANQTMTDVIAGTSLEATMRAGKGSVPHFQLAIGMTGDGARRRIYDTVPGLRELLRPQSSLLEGENGGLTPTGPAV